jgi:glycosyltransferase involved in cell wall biosynthesis
MRVLLTTDTVGGVWTFTRELAVGLLQLGNEVALVSFGGFPSREQTRWCRAMRTRYGGAFRFDSSPAPLEWMPANDLAYVGAEPLLLRVADEFLPQLLHSNQFCFGSLPLAIPRLVTAHSDVLSWASACRPEGLDVSPWLTQYRILVNRGLEAADAVVAPTQWMLRELHCHFPIRCESHVILNGRSIDGSAANQTRALQAVCAGRLWDEAKNVAILSELDCPLPIVIAGSASQESLQAPKFSPNVTFAGKLDEEDLLALFGKSSVYVATSIYEPFGLAPLEAALCGCAIVANDIASLREVWADGAQYFENPDALNRVLTELSESQMLLERCRRASLQRAMRFTRDRMVTSYLALYNNLLSTQQPIKKYERAVYA